MVGFLERLFGRNGGDTAKSGKIAKDRLQLVLVQDRVNLSAEKLQEMKREMIEVLSKYVAIDMENVDFNLSNRERSGLLVAEIPFLAVTPPDDETPEAEGDELPLSVAEADDDPPETNDTAEADELPLSVAEADDDPPETNDIPYDDDPTKPLSPQDLLDD